MSTSGNVFPTGTMSLISAGVVLDLPFHDFLQEMEVEIISGGAWRAQIRLFDHQGDRLEKIIIAAGKDRDINFQWGWDDQRVHAARHLVESGGHRTLRVQAGD